MSDPISYFNPDAFSDNFTPLIQGAINNVFASDSYATLSGGSPVNVSEIIFSSNFAGFEEFASRVGVDANFIQEWVDGRQAVSGATVDFTFPDGTVTQLVFINENVSTAYRTTDGSSRQASLEEVVFHELGHTFIAGADSESQAISEANQYREEVGIPQRDVSGNLFGPGGTFVPGLLPKSLNQVNQELEEFQNRNGNCFLASTLIDMADGTQKPIEEITASDLVMAFSEDANGRAQPVPKRVKRTFVNQVDDILDVHGLMVTPGHVTLCGDGPFEGQFRKIIDIICDDGAIVDRDGHSIRAATNCRVGSEGDHFVELSYIEGVGDKEVKRARVRAGTLLMQEGGSSVSILEVLCQKGLKLLENGFVQRNGEEAKPLNWFGSPPKPEDYILKKSNLARDDLTRLKHHADLVH